MFNPKQALQRIRRTKHQKQQAKTPTQSYQPLFPTPQQGLIKSAMASSNPQLGSPKSGTAPSPNIEDRVSKLQQLVSRLTQQLTTSNDAVDKLKRQNSNLETQILKLQYENSQLKMSQVYSGVRRNGSSKKFNQTIQQQTSPEYKTNQKFSSIFQKPRKVQSHLISADRQPRQPRQRQKFSIQVQQIIEDIKNEPIEQILKRKQYQFRARKPDQKVVTVGNKYLRQLAAIEKQYAGVIKKPVLVIKLDDADFE